MSKIRIIMYRMEEVIEAWNSEHRDLPENAVLLTVEDGYIDNFTMVFS